MTELNKPVCRRTCSMFAHYGRRIVVVLEPGDLLAMRLERTRLVYRATLANVYRQLALWAVEAEARRQREERKARRRS
jgi:hypothetical protein